MIAREWPNKLGWDVGNSEVWKQSDGRLRVFSGYRVAIVASTKDPVEAVKVTRRSGLIREELEQMPFEDALAIFGESIL